MKRIAQIISFSALTATVVAPLLFFADQISLIQVQLWLLVAAMVWFVTAPLWMEHKTSE